MREIGESLAPQFGHPGFFFSAGLSRLTSRWRTRGIFARRVKLQVNGVFLPRAANGAEAFVGEPSSSRASRELLFSAAVATSC